MSQTPSVLDPFGLLRGIGARLEQLLEQAANQGVRSEAFAKGMHSATGVGLTARKLGRQWQTLVLEAMNMPTRTDVLALAEKLQALEDRVIALSTGVERLGHRSGALPPALPSPPRTRRPAALAAPATPAPRTAAKASKARKARS